MKIGKLCILMLEDLEADIFFVRRALEKLSARHTLFAVHDGREAIAYLQGEGQYADRSRFPMPNIILSDLKMPGMDGFEFLQWLRDHPQCNVIPTIVYSSSSREDDVRKAYALGANTYLTKPGSLTEMTEFLRLTLEYWSRSEILPAPGRC